MQKNGIDRSTITQIKGFLVKILCWDLQRMSQKILEEFFWQNPDELCKMLADLSAKLKWKRSRQRGFHNLLGRS